MVLYTQNNYQILQENDIVEPLINEQEYDNIPNSDTIVESNDVIKLVGLSQSHI